MNLSAILLELYRRTTQSATPPADVITRFTSHVNLTHRQLLGLPGLDVLRDDRITFASVIGQSIYGLAGVAKIEDIVDPLTQIRLTLRSLDWLRSYDPGLVMTGASDSYINRGPQQVAQQPAAATGLWAVSSNAGDVQNVFVQTVRTGGFPSIPAATVMTGVARVQIGALTDHIEVTKFYLSTAAVGTVDLFDAAVAGNLLARIPIGQTFARYNGIQLYPTPASVITYNVDYVRTIPDLVNATDEPLLPEDFHWVIVEGALIKEWTKIDDSRRAQAMADYKAGVSALKYFVTCLSDDLPRRRRVPMGRNRLGAYFGNTYY